MVKQVVEQRQIPIQRTCRLFDISETCYRYQPKLAGENARVADWLLRLSVAHRTETPPEAG